MSRPPSRKSGGQRGRNGAKPKRALSHGWQSRMAAAQLLNLTLDDGLDLDEAMERCESYSKLEGSDRGFARVIASAALRALGRIDAALAGFLDRPIDKLDPPVRALLRCGCAQLWVLEAPPYAVVSATVDAARQWPAASRGGGLVNAILRRADRERDAWTKLPATAIWPDWLTAQFKTALGEDRTIALATRQVEEPRIDLTVKSDPEGWAEKLGGEHLPNGSIRLPTGAPLMELPGYADGDWWVQDVAASLAAPLLGDVKGKRVADLCAAPGGKAMQMAAAGADVTALDLSADRLEYVRANLDRTQLKATLVKADAVEWTTEAPFDAILLDAPCSALGTLRRHPDGAWKRTAKGLERYKDTQKRLLNSAHGLLKPDGVLVYCVCTPLSDEGMDVMAEAISSGDWTALPIKPEDVPGFGAAITPEGWLLTAPTVDESTPVSDVFFMARLQKA